jgi:hypothetical protein
MKKKIDKRIDSDFMKGNSYAKKDWSINDTSSLLKNPHYKKFYKEKKMIQSKYDNRLFEWSKTRPPVSIKNWYIEEGREQWLMYLKEIGDLIYKQNGDFQEFLWEIVSEHNKEIMERRARGSLWGEK